MSTSDPTLNHWLILYITQQRTVKSRYDIDRYLIDAGVNPQEIEAVWQHLAPKFIEPRFQRLRRFINLKAGRFTRSILLKASHFAHSILKIRIRNKWLIIYLGLIILGFLINSADLLPIKFRLPALYFAIAVISLIGTVGLLIWNVRRKNKMAGNKWLVYILICILGFVGLFSGIGGLLVSNYRYIEVANTSSPEHKYHLVYSIGCVESCSAGVTFYKCNSSNLFCSDISTYWDYCDCENEEPTQKPQEPMTLVLSSFRHKKEINMNYNSKNHTVELKDQQGQLLYSYKES